MVFETGCDVLGASTAWEWWVVPVPGDRWYRINGEEVTEAEFTARARAAGLLKPTALPKTSN